MASTEVSVLQQLAESVRDKYILAHTTDWEESTAPAEESRTLVFHWRPQRESK